MPEKYEVFALSRECDQLRDPVALPLAAQRRQIQA
jgi:hypothetical protein